MKTEYIDGLRAELHGRFEGSDIYSVRAWDGRVIFQGTLEECRRYVRLHHAKVAAHEERVRLSRREVS
jgi:hypothetical protein